MEFERDKHGEALAEAKDEADRRMWRIWSILPFTCCTAGGELFRSGAMEEIKSEKQRMENVEEGGSAGQNEARSRLGGWRTMPFIFGNELSEKLAVVGFSTNMLTYLTQQLHMPLVKAANTLTNFGGTASLTPLLGAFVADAFAGRFWTITIASVIYQMGMVLLTLSAVLPSLRPPACRESCEEASRGQYAVLYAALLLTALGAGGIRPCVVAFGADQFDEKDPAQGKRLWGFFNWYYFCMGLSILTAVTVIVYVQDNVGWGWGLGVPTAAMAISIVAFVAGHPLYRHFKPAGSPLTRLLQVVVASLRKRHLQRPCDPALLYHNRDRDAAVSTAGRLKHTDQMTFFDTAAVPRDSDFREGQPDPWRLCTVHQVEELKSVIRMGPIWSAGILLVTASAQQGTFSLQQARTMDRRVGRSFQIPAASMSVFTILSLLSTIFAYDRLLMPVARRFTGRDRGISFLQRMGVGFFVSVLATLAAGFIEVKRKSAAAQHGLLDSPKATIPLSVFWLVPQYGLHGMAEAFMSIGHLEFFYDQSPESMRSTATALFWTAISAGSYLSTFLVSVVHRTTGGEGRRSWLPDNLNRGRLEYFYWLITVLQLINLFYYLLCARFYTFKPIETVPDDVAPKHEGPAAATSDDRPVDDQFPSTQALQLVPLQSSSEKMHLLKPHKSL